MSERPSEVPPEDADAVVRTVLGALRHDGSAPTDVQRELLEALAVLAFERPLDVDAENGLTPAEAAAAISDPSVRRVTVSLLVAMEFASHGLSAELDASVRAYAKALGVSEPLLKATHALAQGHLVGMYADIERHSWYTHETARRVLGGHGFQILRSKLAALGWATDLHEAARWRALGECPSASWGRAVYDFYQRHDFSFPGEHASIRLVGAEHDWVHVLAGYDTDPEGEIDVFTFIAGSKRDEQGLAMLASTLGLFQNGSIHRIAGTRIPTATADTLSIPGAPARFADAFHRGRETTADVLGGFDHFEWASVPLDEARLRLNVRPKRDL